MGGFYSVIDGRQRLTAIQLFFANKLVLQDLTELEELNGLKFDDLPPQLIGSLSMRPLRATTLLRQTDPDVKYLVFHRLNTAGEALNSQEIRNVIYRGSLNDLLFEMAGDSWLRSTLKIQSDTSSAYRKMQDLEFVLRYLTLSQHWQAFSGDLARTMDQFMHVNQHVGEKELGGFRQTFTEALERCQVLWGKHAFRRPEGTQWRDQALAGLFDAQMIAASLLTREEFDSLSNHSDRALKATRAMFKDAEFEKSVRTGTNTPSRVKYRIEELYKRLGSEARR